MVNLEPAAFAVFYCRGVLAFLFFSTRRHLSLVGGFVILAAVLLTPSLAPAKHKITWKPSSVNVTIEAGESKTVSVTFKTRRKLKNLVVQVSPELEPFVQIDPQEFRKIRKKKKNKLTITISAPAGSLPGTIQGTIQLKELKKGKPAKKSLARTLPVTVNVLAIAQIVNNGLTINFGYPSDWTISPEDSKRRLYSPTSTAAIAEGDLVTPPDITITLLDNSSGLSLIEFIEMYRNGWFANYEESIPITIDGHEAIRVSDLTADIPSVPGLAAFVTVDDMVVLITGHENNQQQFDDAVASLELP